MILPSYLRLRLVTTTLVYPMINISRTVLTAAHCLCSYFDKVPSSHVYCKINTEQGPSNQQTGENDPARNYIFIKVGNIDRTKAKEYRVEKAYVMETDLDAKDPNPFHVILGEKYDLGIIITTDDMVMSPNVNTMRLPPR